MNLSVRDVSRMLSVDEKQVFRWIEEREIPFTRVHEQYSFNRAEVLEWAIARGMGVNVEALSTRHPPVGGPLELAHALALGGVHYDLPGDDRESVLRAVAGVLRLHDPADRDLLVDLLLAREGLSSTGVGDGIAIPHARTPVVFDVEGPNVALCFLQKPVDFAAIDGKPVTTLFVLTSTNVRTHLQLLSRISMAVHDPAFREALLRRAPREDILADARRIDEKVKAR
jgi:PTS system nitrogen regulatory IIA component